MRSQVIVSWGEAQEYKFDLEEKEPMPNGLAREWLDQQFVDLGCEPLRLSGKVLLADKVAVIARTAGEAHFSDPAHRAWAQAFAQAASATLARPVVHIDVPTMTVSY
ncbi:hypothetical protein [Serpentinimonas maccroryi]|uniref:hypothetical protein n=1 Tax=Serpentinimonas maccroryi TaxID=1458426 RepID=UPI000BDB3D34|nr:hypothetical protein [Serpentinimonas maccroryi]MBA4252554.1 hypothetical protein [Comamonadaceae bacterium]MCM2479423.1 hypothetical protein [Serpentinimonas maccroryi]OZA85878.1 MAG: hypothetical protein B7X56_05480 [Burkholderiales bacterium 34-67-9]